MLHTGFRTFHFVSFLYVFFFSFLFLLFRFFSHYFVFVFLRFVFFRFFSLLFSLFSFRFFSFRFFSFLFVFFRFSVYRYPYWTVHRDFSFIITLLRKHVGEKKKLPSSSSFEENQILVKDEISKGIYLTHTLISFSLGTNKSKAVGKQSEKKKDQVKDDLQFIAKM